MEIISFISYEYLVDEVFFGVRILFDDGKLEMLVEEVDIVVWDFYCWVIVGGIFFSNKGVNFFGVCFFVKVMIDKDKEDLMFGLD